MSFISWIIIIAKILLLIGEGMPKKKAVAMASAEFGVPESEIWKRGGF